YQTAHFDPAPPRSINPLIPRDLETICRKCIEKEPSRRYPDAGAVAHELRRFLDGKAILARPAGPGEKLVRWVRRNPLGAGFVASFVVAFVAVTLLAIVAARASSEARKNESLALANSARADDERYFNKLLTAGSYFQLQNYPALRQSLDAIPP